MLLASAEHNVCYWKGISLETLLDESGPVGKTSYHHTAVDVIKFAPRPVHFDIIDLERAVRGSALYRQGMAVSQRYMTYNDGWMGLRSTPMT
jgi:hypothetical protein